MSFIAGIALFFTLLLSAGGAGLSHLRVCAAHIVFRLEDFDGQMCGACEHKDRPATGCPPHIPHAPEI